MTSEPRSPSGPNEQHHLHTIDPFLLDRRNCDLDRIVARQFDDSPVQDCATEALLAVPALPVLTENAFLPEDISFSPCPAVLEATQHILPQEQPAFQSQWSCAHCLKPFTAKYKLKRV